MMDKELKLCVEFLILWSQAGESSHNLTFTCTYIFRIKSSVIAEVINSKMMEGGSAAAVRIYCEVAVVRTGMVGSQGWCWELAALVC